MLDRFDLDIESFKLDYPDKLKLYVFACGGGASLARMMETPGCSSFLGAMVFPYSKEELDMWKGPQIEKYVSEEANLSYIETWSYPPGQSRVVVITAALPSMTGRKGANKAIITIATVNSSASRKFPFFGRRPDEVKHRSYKLSMTKETPFNEWHPSSEHPEYSQYITKSRIRQDKLVARAAMGIMLGQDDRFMFDNLEDGESLALCH